MTNRESILVKPVNFRFGDYISNSFELYKNNFGQLFLGFIFVMILSIIPFCSYMAIGNYFKLCRKIKNGEHAEASEIFNFDDFSKYIILQLIIFGAVIGMIIPIMFFMPVISAFENGGDPSPIFMMFFFIYYFAILAVIIYFSTRLFYIIGLISLLKIDDLNTAWKMTSTMVKGNYLQIILFSIIISIIGQIGIIACVIGVFLTLPIYYIAFYYSNEDGIDQITVKDQNEVGNLN